MIVVDSVVGVAVLACAVFVIVAWLDVWMRILGLVGTAIAGLWRLGRAEASCVHTSIR